MNLKHIPQAELTRDPGRILEAVGAGRPVVVETAGKPPAAILDFVDFQLLMAVIRYYVDRPQVDPGAGLEDAQIAGQTGQSRFDAAVAHYLAGSISLSRTAEVLRTSWLDLRTRFSRLGVPVRTGPVDEEGARQDALVAESFAS